jgi:hypothetical protein
MTSTKNNEAVAECYLDTTFLVGCLFLTKRDAKPYWDALTQYSTVNVPEYAHKELKIGVIRNLRWAYTKLVLTESVVDTLAAIQSHSLTPARYRTATAIQAIRLKFKAALDQLLIQNDESDQVKTGNSDKRLARILSLELKQAIAKGWNRRRMVGKTVFPLDCYPREQIDPDIEPFSTAPDDCPLGTECCMTKALRKREQDIKILRDTISKLPTKAEYLRRNAALRQIQLGRQITRKECRDLGDAYFVLTCVKNWVILSTNTRDFQPMAQALKLRLKNLE